MSRSDAGNDFKAQVLGATDIVELIGQTVALKRRGKDYLGLCPFHQEKTPSFHVSPSRQFFHCFGCKEHGNAIDFIIKRDRIEFIEALRQLGERANLEMPQFGASREKRGERQALLDANSAAASFFEKTLADPSAGTAAREYLSGRGFSDESLKQFHVGLAPPGWDGLLKSPAMRRFTPAQLALAGLIKPRTSGDGNYDAFRNRLMWPIRDVEGRVIAFGGRVMPGSEDPAKYLNTPETPLFSKSECVFGLDLAKQRIVETRTAILVEGYCDAHMCHQQGVKNVVSILGTAMTERHVAKLRRFADRMVLLFDPDTAGDAAVNRSVELFLTQPIEILIATMPEDLDPDEYLLKHGAEAFSQVIAGAQDALTYKWKQLTRDFRANQDLTSQQKAVEEYLKVLASARGSGPVDSLRWGAVLARVQRLTGIPVEQLNRRFRPARGSGRQGPRAPVQAGSAEQPTMEASDAAPPDSSEEPEIPVSGAQSSAEADVLGALLLEPGLWVTVQQHLSPSDFLSRRSKALAERIWDHQRHEGEPVFNEFLSWLNDPALSELAIELVEQAESRAGRDEKTVEKAGKSSGPIQADRQALEDAVNYFAHQREERERMARMSKARELSVEDDSAADLLRDIERGMKVVSARNRNV